MFNFNPQKAVEAILWIANQRPGTVGVYQIVKTFFFGDLHHLNKYGRPIAGDFYCAMPYGPTPSGALNVLNGDAMTCAELGDLPFKKNGHNIIPARAANLDYLSESDIEALLVGWNKVKDLDFPAIRNLAHDHPAYKKTWDKRSSAADIINFSDLIEDPEKTKAIRELAPFIKI